MSTFEALHNFFHACMAGDAGYVERLLSSRSIDPNERIPIEFNAFTPLYLAISPGCPEEGSYKILSLLLNYGANPNILCSNHGTPLCVAAQKSDARFVEKLLENGADPNIVGEAGDSPLFASLGAPGDDNAAKLALINAGADIEFVNPSGYPLLFMAANLGKTNFVELLLRSGANINRGYAEGPSLHTPLNIAVKRKQYSVVQVLLEHGALEYDINEHPCRKFGTSVSLDSIYGMDKRMEDLLISYGACPSSSMSRETFRNVHESAQMINDVLNDQRQALS